MKRFVFILHPSSFWCAMARPANVVPFFRVWTPEMAYVLGYWWADGCMRIKVNTTAHLIEIASNDLDNLYGMAAAIGTNYYLRRVSPKSNTFVISFCSKEMYRDLEAIGGTPAKSRTIGFPVVPSELLAHFVRGVVDGDGTLSWNAGKPIVQIYSGSPVFLEVLAVAVERDTGIPAPCLSTNRSNWYIKWSTMRAKCLVAWLYLDNSGLAMERKAAIATQFVEWQPKKRPLKGTITDNMRSRFAKYILSV